jgi:hypothetical protein
MAVFSAGQRALMRTSAAKIAGKFQAVMVVEIGRVLTTTEV